jgi:hypothetical protein
MENYTFKDTFLAWTIPKKSLAVLGGSIFFLKKELMGKGQCFFLWLKIANCVSDFWMHYL